MFAVILTPLLFTGSAQFPWRSLSDDLLWFKVICALNPLPIVLLVLVLVLVIAIAGFGGLGPHGFVKLARLTETAPRNGLRGAVRLLRTYEA